MEKERKSKVIYVSFNDDSSFFAIGLETGFEVYRSCPLEKVVSEKLFGGIAIAELFGQTNIIALVGGGKYPILDSNKVSLYDMRLGEIAEEFRVDNKINALKIKDKW